MSIPQNKLDVFVNMLEIYATMSKDPRTKVSAMILNHDFSIVSMGYNGFPAGFPDHPHLWEDRETKNAIVIHAEENAIDYARGSNLEGCYLICSHYPCPRCAAKVIKRKIAKVYYFNQKRPDHNCGLTDQMFKDAGVLVEFIG